MTTHEWIMLIIVLLGGFWTLNRQLAKIEVALSGKVSYNDCAERQTKCPCRSEITKIQNRIDEVHPPQK